VVGVQGLILTSSTAGAQWTVRDAGTAAIFTDVWGSGDERFAATIDGDIFHSANAGASWSTRAKVPIPVHGIFGIDPQRLWAVGGYCVLAGNEVYRTTDGAKSWKASSTKNNIYCLNDIWAADAMHVWAVGQRAGSKYPVSDAVVVKSDDGGDTWLEVVIGDGSLKSIWGADASHLWTAGVFSTVIMSQGFIAQTVNGGESWTREYWGPSSVYEGLWVSSANQAWGVGGAGAEQGTGLFSTAGMCPLPAAQPQVGPEGYHAVHGTADGKHIWVVGEQGVIAVLDRP
jgi:hypothetical protein